MGLILTATKLHPNIYHYPDHSLTLFPHTLTLHSFCHTHLNPIPTSIMLATRLIVAILSSVALVSAAPIPALGHFVDETGGIADKHQLSGHRGFDSRAAAWQGWQVPQKHLNQYARVVQWPTNEVTSCGHYLDAFANDEPWVAVPPSYGHATW